MYNHLTEQALALIVTSASTQEIAASAQSLATTAAELNELVQRFTLTPDEACFGGYCPPSNKFSAFSKVLRVGARRATKG